MTFLLSLVRGHQLIGVAIWAVIAVAIVAYQAESFSRRRTAALAA